MASLSIDTGSANKWMVTVAVQEKEQFSLQNGMCQKTRVWQRNLLKSFQGLFYFFWRGASKYQQRCSKA